MTGLPQLAFEHVSYQNGGKEILRDLSFSVAAGDFLAVTGPSGSGKSTLFRLCCHLISPTDGRILVDGEDMLSLDPVGLRKRIVYCFQTPVLFGNTVEDNLAFPCSVRDRKFDAERAGELLDRFQLGPELLKHGVRNLSGGERQRVALVRALLFEPELLLLDEPTSALDELNTGIVEQAVKSLNRTGVTVLWITHDPARSREYARSLLTVRDGRIESLEVLA